MAPGEAAFLDPGLKTQVFISLFPSMPGLRKIHPWTLHPQNLYRISSLVETKLGERSNRGVLRTSYIDTKKKDDDDGSHATHCTLLTLLYFYVELHMKIWFLGTFLSFPLFFYLFNSCVSSFTFHNVLNI